MSAPVPEQVRVRPQGEGALPIRTTRLTIRDFADDDHDSIHRYASDPVVTRFMSWGPNREEDTRDFLEQAMRVAGELPRRSFELAVVMRDVDELIGGCGLYPRRDPCGEHEIGYCLRRDRWGIGLGQEVARALVTFGFGVVGAHRICARVDPDNARSRRVLERVGFRLEGFLRQDTLVRGRWRDSLLYGILSSEWRG